jgi:hypothetical protein
MDMTQQPAEQSNTSKEVRPSARTSKRKASTPAKRHITKKEEIPAVESGSTNTPPRRQKNEALILKHYRLRAVDVRQATAVAEQRSSDVNDVVRKIYERGANIEAALGASSEDGLYGLYRGPRLAELLRQDIDGLIGFALNQGVVPTVIQEYRGIIQGLNETIQGLRTQITSLPLASVSQAHQQPTETALTAGTEISDEADTILGMFFGSPSNDET